MYRKKVLAIIVLVLALSLLVVSIPPVKAKFVIAGWDYPDEHGQGIEYLKVYQNNTGSYVEFEGSPFYSSSNIELEIETTGFIWIQVLCWFNRTIVGIPNILQQGLNRIQHDAIVTHSNGTVVFSQQNFTRTASSQAGDPIWWLRYDVILTFVPQYSQTYTATITYEVFY